MTPKKQEMVQVIGSPGHASKLRLDSVEGPLVEQIAQLLHAQQLAEQLAVERKRLGAALCRRRVVLVHVGRDVVEEQRRGERRGRGRLDLDHVDLARCDLAKQVTQAGKVEDILKAFPVGL